MLASSCLLCGSETWGYYCSVCSINMKKCDCGRIIKKSNNTNLKEELCDTCTKDKMAKDDQNIFDLYKNTLDTFLNFASMTPENKKNDEKQKLSFIRQDGKRFRLEILTSVLTINFCKLLLSEILNTSPTKIIFIKDNKQIIEHKDLLIGDIHVAIKNK